jgi:hypothetical protein
MKKPFPPQPEADDKPPKKGAKRKPMTSKERKAMMAEFFKKKNK